MTDSPTKATYNAAVSDDDANHSHNSSRDEWVPLSVIEGRYVARVLEHTRGNKQAAARVLGVDRKTLDRMIKRHHIETRSSRAKTSTAAAHSTPQS